jgi:hypothetical protein
LADDASYRSLSHSSLRWHKQLSRILGHREATRIQEIRHMSDAQVGLVMATPLIVIFAVMLYRMGVLRPTGTITAVTMSVVIAAVLFLTQ